MGGKNSATIGNPQLSQLYEMIAVEDWAALKANPEFQGTATNCPADPDLGSKMQPNPKTNTTPPENMGACVVTCAAVKQIWRQLKCCGKASADCNTIKTTYKNHECCGNPAKSIPRPEWMF